MRNMQAVIHFLVDRSTRGTPLPGTFHKQVVCIDSTNLLCGSFGSLCEFGKWRGFLELYQVRVAQLTPRHQNPSVAPLIAVVGSCAGWCGSVSSPWRVSMHWLQLSPKYYRKRLKASVDSPTSLITVDTCYPTYPRRICYCYKITQSRASSFLKFHKRHRDVEWKGCALTFFT